MCNLIIKEMKKLALILMICIIPSYGFTQQQWDNEYGEPLVILTEIDPWLMVIGSDVPTIAIYESGKVVYRRIEKDQMEYYSVKLDSEQTQQLIFDLEITEEFIDLPEYIQASDWFDLPTNELILNFDTVIVKQVYGSLRDENEDRKRTPTEFLAVYDNLIKYKSENEERWLPDYIEILLTDYSHSPEEPIKWPKEWPDLNDETTILRSEFLYSVYIPKSEFQKFIDLISKLEEKQAVELNGKKFSISYRLPFPNLR
jgi:hypothetical protein